jgi:hypothetical protein
VNHRGGREGVGESNGRGDLTKVNCTHSGDASRNPLNIDFGISNRRQDCEIGTMLRGACGRRRRVNEGDEGEGVWLTGFTHMYKIEQCNLTQLLEVRWEGAAGERWWEPSHNVQCKAIGNCHNESPCTTNIS